MTFPVIFVTLWFTQLQLHIRVLITSSSILLNVIYVDAEFVWQRENLPHLSLNPPPSCHRVKVTCDDLPHPFCAHWMQHYAALWNYFLELEIHLNPLLGCIFLVFSDFSWCWPLIFFVSPPFHPPTHLFFVASMCPSVCWLPVYCVVFVLRLFCLWCPRCVCALPRRWSFHGSCGPRCWCICWIWWVTKQLRRFVCEGERVCQSACCICYKSCFCFLTTVE